MKPYTDKGVRGLPSADDLLGGYTDGDQNNLSIKSISAAGASITASGDGEWNLVPAKDYSGEITVSFIIDDGNQGFALGETTVNLLAVNDPPVPNQFRGVVPAELLIGFQTRRSSEISIW